eukprot:419356_1
MEESSHHHVHATHALVQEPAWMCVLALLLRKKCITSSQAESILYALVHLEACKYRFTNTDTDTVDEKKSSSSSSKKVVVVTLPGQGCTMSLLPLIVKLFPHQRHVFAYSGYIPAVERGLMLALTDTNASRQRKSKKSQVDLSSSSSMAMNMTIMPA